MCALYEAIGIYAEEGSGDAVYRSSNALCDRLSHTIGYGTQLCVHTVAAEVFIPTRESPLGLVSDFVTLRRDSDATVHRPRLGAAVIDAPRSMGAQSPRLHPCERHSVRPAAIHPVIAQRTGGFSRSP